MGGRRARFDRVAPRPMVVADRAAALELSAEPAGLTGAARPEVIRFGRLELRLDERRALLDGRPLQLQRRPYQVLEHLAVRSGQVVSRRELLAVIWGTRFIYDHALEQAVYEVRRSIAEPGWIITVPQRGYRFEVPV